ncbi:MAG: hypothetical protein KA152_01120 [Verrucomicrobiales bacterium]|nr:hypothetical protein [Verrucomicrobiales bacterium]HQW29308.1 hypothetical protein [Verrucomicrobiales bacterium]
MSSLAGSRHPVDVSLSVSEFPDWLSPIFVRDLRQGLRARFFVWGFLVLQSIAMLAALVEWAVMELLGTSGIGPLFSGAFAGITSIVFGLLLPLSLFDALQPELGRGRNVELLLTSQLSRWQIVRGKLLVASTLSTLLLTSLLPYFLIRYFLGGVELTTLFGTMFSLLFSNMAMNAIIIGASAFSSYVWRLFIILLLVLFYNFSSGSYAIRSAIMGGSPANAALDLAGRGLITALCIILSLQLGRSKLKLDSNSIDPPTTALIFIFMFLTLLIHTLALSLGGTTVSLVTLAILIALALLIDRSPRLKNDLKTERDRPLF